MVGVTFTVTKGLAVPAERLETAPYAERVEQLASKESANKGLIDEGARAQAPADVRLLAKGHYHGFVNAVCSAFANHYPLALRPQHFWIMILQGVAKHVEKNAETVRKQWVRHEGKRELLVRRDGFVKGAANNDWASVVVGPSDSFAAQIDGNTVTGVSEGLSPAFSGTTALERVCEKITVMDVCKSFFSFKMATCCGFPRITLEGTAEDWALLCSNAAALIGERCEESWARSWLSALVPLLDKIHAEYVAAQSGSAPADEPFWNSMCKRGGTSGSGSRTWFNGWINILFPYILDAPNAYCVPYAPTNEYVLEGRDGGGLYPMHAPSGVQGPDCADFPSGLADARVMWDCLGEQIPLAFRAGFVGATQDGPSGTVSPALGWFITHANQEQSIMDDPSGGFCGMKVDHPGGRVPPRSGFSRLGHPSLGGSHQE